MSSLYELELKAKRREPFLNARGMPLGPGVHAVVKVERGDDLGRVVRQTQKVSIEPVVLEHIAATEADLRAAARSSSATSSSGGSTCASRQGR